MTERRIPILLAIDAILIDDTWTLDDLRANAIHYLESIVDRAERNHAHDDDTAYRLDTDDATVFLADEFCDEVRIAAEAGLAPIAALPACDRRTLWFATPKETT